MAEQNGILLAPSTVIEGRIDQFHTLSTSRVTIDPDSTDTFTIEEWVNGKKQEWESLTKPAISRIAQAAGISFDPDRTGINGTPTREYLSYTAVAAMKLPDGQVMVAKGTVEWMWETEVAPIDEKIAEMQAEYDAMDDKSSTAAKRLNGKLWGQKKHRTDAIKYRVPMVESKAMNRAVRQLLGLKSKYTKAELDQPFVVPRIDENPDITDPYVREVLAGRAASASAALYAAPKDAVEAAELPPAPADVEPVEEATEIPADLTMADGEEPEDAGEAEVVDEGGEDEDLEAEMEAMGFEKTDEIHEDPADYVITDENSTFKGKTLGEVVKEKPRYCRFIVSKGLGTPELQDACVAFMETYQEDFYAEVVTTDG